MRIVIKIALIVAVLMVGTIALALVKEATGRGNSSGSGGPLGIVVIVAMLAAIRAIWKYQPATNNPSNDNADKHTLNKN